MDTKMLLVAAVLFLGLCVAMCLIVDQAHAAGQGKSIAEKTGMELGSMDIDEDRLPGKGKMALGIGSIFVMIAVMKYL